MSAELELIRGFHAQEAAVDAASSEAARSQLLAYIGAAERGEQPAVGFLRRLGPRRVRHLPRGPLIMGALAVLVVIGVVAVFIRVGGGPAARPAGRGGARPPAFAANPPGQLRNLAPAPLTP